MILRLIWKVSAFCLVVFAVLALFLDPNASYLDDRIKHFAETTLGEAAVVDGPYGKGFFVGGGYVSATDVEIPWPLGGDTVEVVYPAKELRVGYSVSRAALLQPAVYVSVKGLKFDGMQVDAELWLAWDDLSISAEIDSFSLGENVFLGHISLKRAEADAPFTEISGELYSPYLDLAALPTQTPQGETSQKTPFDMNTLRDYTADLTVQISQLAISDVVLGQIKGRLESRDKGRVTMTLEDSRLSQGHLEGTVVFDATGALPTLSVQTILQGFDYGVMVDRNKLDYVVDGKIDLEVDITAAAQDGDLSTLYKNWDGKIRLTGGSGQIGHRALNFWSQDLLLSIIPILGQITEESPVMDLNCVVAEMNITGGKGKLEPLLLDTQRLTIAGQGEYDFYTHTIGVVIRPRPKNIKLLDLSSPVRLQGSIVHPTATPAVLGTLQKVGEMALTAVNPLALVIPTVKAVTADRNPCVAALNPEENPAKKDIKETP